MLIYFKICCDDIKYRLIKEKKKQNNCERTIVVGTLKQSWLFFLVLCISTLLTLKMSVLRRNNNVFFAGLGEIAGLDLLLAFLREIDRQ